MSKKRKLLLYGVLIALNLAIIWGNSMQNGETSGDLSEGVLKYLWIIFSVFGDRAEFVLRKLAHFTEFACLGFLLARTALLLEQTGFHRFSLPLLPGVLAACVDETIQIYSEGRASSLLDVWIDTAGICFGILLLTFLVFLIAKCKQ